MQVQWEQDGARGSHISELCCHGPRYRQLTGGSHKQLADGPRGNQAQTGG